MIRLFSYLIVAFIPAFVSARSAYQTDRSLPFLESFIILFAAGFLALVLFRKLDTLKDISGGNAKLLFYVGKWTCVLVYILTFMKFFYSTGNPEPGVQLSTEWVIALIAVYYGIVMLGFQFTNRSHKG